MNAKDIMAKKFEMVLRGYKTEEVEEFLREVSLEVSRLHKENEDLEKKLTVLADKIREYREDEDTLKDALLGAQRQGNALIADSKRKAAEIIEETQAKAGAMIKKAEEGRQKLKEKGDNEIKAAEEKAASIIDNANQKAKEIEVEMNLKTDIQKEILHRTTDEIADFKTRIINAYKKHMESIEKVAGECKNEFIKKTLKDGRPNIKTESISKAESVTSKEVSKSQPQPKTTPKKPKPSVTENTKTAAEPYDDSEYDAEEGDLVKMENDAIKFEVDVNEAEFNSDYSAINDTEDDEITGDTAEVPLFKPKVSNKYQTLKNQNSKNADAKPNLKKGSEIFFKKSPESKNSNEKSGDSRSKSGKTKLKFGADNSEN